MMKPAFALTGALALFATGASAQVTNPVSLGASMTGQPVAFDVPGLAYVVDGYRSAKWGMTPDQVRAAIARDLPGARIGAATVDPVERTTVIVAQLPALAPGPGPAAISYIFGAQSGTLFHVNLDWSAEQANAADRAALTAAGAQAVQSLVGYYWKLMTVARGIALGPNALSLFAATGEAGGLVDIRLQGVGYRLERPEGGAVVMPPPPDGTPALLHIGWAQSATPDVYRIRPGEF